MKVSMQNLSPVLLRPAAADPATSRSSACCLPALCSLAASSWLICCLPSASAGEAVPANESASRPAQAKLLAGEPQGHQMKRYQAFARQTALPLIAVTSETTLKIGEAAGIDLARLAELSAEEKKALAAQFEVPAGVIVKVLQSAAANQPLAAAEVAGKLRLAVIDYRFLQQEWNRYHPSQENQQAKAQALESLQAGDLAQAWALYDELPRPQPPANLRIVATQ